MLVHAPSVLDNDDIKKVFDLYKNSNNSIKLNDVITDRHWASQIGNFLITEFTNDEFSFVWDKVKKLFPEDTELVYSRVLKYNRNCFIPSHIDTYDEDWQQANDISVIIQLNPRDDYTGGDAIVSNQLFELNPGDCIYYTYDNEHEIKKIKSGIRYVVNLRCKSVK